MTHPRWVVLFLASVWLLWVQDEHFSHPNPETGRWDRHTVEWQAIGAFFTEERCRDRLQEAMAEAVSQRTAPRDAKMWYKTDGEAISWLFFPKNARPSDPVLRSHLRRYSCLPETSDPRRPQ